MKTTAFILLMMCMAGVLKSQTPRNLMPRVINIPEKNHVSPSLSGDGKHMVFVSNYSVSGRMVMKYTSLNEFNQWSEPVELTAISRVELDNIGGHSLSYDGTLLFFTSKRSPNIGKYDIFFSERKGNYWTPAQNIGKPINSSENEGHPSLSPDGRNLYFMRCKEMDNTKADGCELYVAERRSENYWHEPKKLPYPINTGNEATPRIMPDGETLMFASKRAGGKGGYDIYLSRFENGQWSAPVACHYLNTELDDQFVSVPAHGNLAYFSTRFRDNFAIIEAQIPEELKPKRVILAQGNIVDVVTQKPLDAVIQVYDALTRERDQFIRPKSDGSFFVLIKGDGIYDFSVITRENKHSYFSKIYDLRGLANSKILDMFIELSPVREGLIFEVDDIQFIDESSQIREESEVALLRLMKFLRDNPGIRIEVGVHVDELVDEHGIETDHDDNMESLEFHSEEVDVDDDYEIEPELESKPVEDITIKRAKAIVDRLIEMGVPTYLVEAKGYGDSQNLVPNVSVENRERNRRVEIRILK